MIIVSESVLIESKSARNNQLAQMPHERAVDVLNKVKAIVFALWQGTGTATTEQLAEFYEVPVGTIRPLLKPHKDEFESDGVKTLRSKALKDARCVIQLPCETSQALVWTPRAALRLGVLLRNSAIAKAIRTSLLDAVEHGVPAQSARIRELELENQNLVLQLELAQTQERLIQTTQAIATLHGAGMLGLILGKPEAVVEPPPTVIEKTILVNQSGRPVRTYQGLSKTKLAKRYGFKKPQDLVNWMQSINKMDLIQPGITAASCQFVPFEYVPELDRLWAARLGSRQRLLGE